MNHLLATVTLLLAASSALAQGLPAASASMPQRGLAVALPGMQAAANVRRLDAPTQDAVEASKKMAMEAAESGRSSGFMLDESGKIVTAVGADGKEAVVNTPRSSESVRDAGRYVQGLLGVESVETLAQPTRGRGAGAATTVTGQADMACSMVTGSQRNANAVQMRFAGCTGAAGNTQMALDVCVAPLFRAETCGTNGFSRLVLRENAYATGPEGVQFGLGCNSKQVCTVSIRASLTLKGTGDELHQQGQAALAADLSNENSMRRQVSTAYNSSDFSRLRSELPVTDVITTIDGSQQHDSNCTKTGVCLEQSTTERKFQRTCDVSFLLTERTERSKLDQGNTATCEQQRGGMRPDGLLASDDYIQSDSCVFTDDTGKQINRREGMTEVGRKLLHKCIGRAWDTCSRGDTYEVYYANLTKYSKVEVGYNPLPLSTSNPVCDERPEAITNLCQKPESWFGRTLSASECTVVSDIEGSFASQPLDFQQKAGCGICTEKTELATCYGQPTADSPADSCAGVDLTGCTFSGAQALTFSDDNAGLVTSQRQTYECSRTSVICTRYEGRTPDGKSCNIGSSDISANLFGLDNAPRLQGDNNAFAQAAVDIAITEEMAAGLQDAGHDNPQLLPYIFSGKAIKCKYPTKDFFGAGNLLSKNCCRTDLKRPKQDELLGLKDGCDEDDVELANARRQSMAHYVGEYCSKRALFGSCLVKTQAHCAYDGLLPRLVAEQGRTQLNELIAGGAVPGTQKAALNFSFYSASNEGSWTAPITVNGVKLAAYQWPKFCSDPAAIAERRSADPQAPACPGALNLWIAGCDASDCGALPPNPELGGDGWGVINVDPLSSLTTASSKYSVVRGACNTATSQCSYEATAWPLGQGGKIVISRDLTFPIWDSSPPTEAEGQGLGVGERTTVMGQQQNISDIFFRPFSYVGAPSNTLPATVRIDFSTNGGTESFTTVNVPTKISGEFLVPGTTDLKLSGSCDVTLNLCQYRLVGTATIEAKGWGTAKRPDCEGFTAGQLSAMDLGKMDLSEWIDDVLARSGVSAGSAMNGVAERLKEQAKGATSGSDGTVTPPSATPAPYALATPPEGFGPFEVSLAAGGWWPYSPAAGAQNAEKVTQVIVDWGDCSTPESMTVVTAMNGQPAHGFRAKRTYKQPNHSSYNSCGLAKEASIDHQVKLTVTTERGNTYRTSLSVRNAWSTFEGVRNNTAPPTGP